VEVQGVKMIDFLFNRSFRSGLDPFESASLSALFKRTATITQAGVGSQTLRSGTVAFKTLRCAIEVAYIFASVKAITVKFLVWENTTRKELHPLELTSKVTTEFAMKAPLWDCSMNVIAKLTL